MHFIPRGADAVRADARARAWDRGWRMHRLPLVALQRVLIACLVATVAVIVLGHSVAYADDGTSSILGAAPFEVAQLGTTGLVGLYSWIATGQRVLKREHEAANKELGKRIAQNRVETDKRLAEVERRLSVAEEAARHAPTASQITQLIESIGSLRGDVRTQGAVIDGMRGEVAAMRNSLRNYEEHMLAKGA